MTNIKITKGELKKLIMEEVTSLPIEMNATITIDGTGKYFSTLVDRIHNATGGFIGKTSMIVNGKPYPAPRSQADNGGGVFGGKR